MWAGVIATHRDTHTLARIHMHTHRYVSVGTQGGGGGVCGVHG